jgi:hypothetical protein
MDPNTERTERIQELERLAQEEADRQEVTLVDLGCEYEDGIYKLALEVGKSGRYILRIDPTLITDRERRARLLNKIREEIERRLTKGNTIDAYCLLRHTPSSIKRRSDFAALAGERCYGSYHLAGGPEQSRSHWCEEGFDPKKPSRRSIPKFRTTYQGTHLDVNGVYPVDLCPTPMFGALIANNHNSNGRNT